MVLAFAPVVTTVIRPLPRIQYCHSLTLGCQCISRNPPGLMVTIAPAIPDATGKLPESTTRISPPAVFCVGSVAAIWKVHASGVVLYRNICFVSQVRHGFSLIEGPLDRNGDDQ